MNADDLYERIVDALENAAFKGEWDYPAESTALQSAHQTAEIVMAVLAEQEKEKP